MYIEPLQLQVRAHNSITHQFHLAALIYFICAIIRI